VEIHFDLLGISLYSVFNLLAEESYIILYQTHQLLGHDLQLMNCFNENILNK